MTRPPNYRTHALKDPGALTEYEKKLWELRQQGLTYPQIAERLGGKSNAKTLAARYQIIRDKIKLREDR